MSLIQCSNLNFTYDGSYDAVFTSASFQLDSNWRTALVGRNGRGKTTLLRLLCGSLSHQGGISGGGACVYFPPSISDQNALTLYVLEEVCPQAEQWQLLRELNLLEIPEDALWRPFSTLSGGEQTRCLLAALFLDENRFPLLDEPTNHLDQAGRQLLADYLSSKPGFLLISHDRAFLDRCTDHVLAIERSGIQVQKGNFSSWWENRQRQEHFELGENEKLHREIGRLQEAARRTSGWSDAVEQSKYNTRDSGLRPNRGFIGHKSAKMMQRAKNIHQRREAAVEEKSALLKNVERMDALKYSQPRLPGDLLVVLRGVQVLYDSAPVGETPLDLFLQTGQQVALSGPNGCGKSSLLRLIAGFPLAHSGVMKLGSGLRISYVAQDSQGLRGNLRDFAREEGLDETRFLTILRKLDFSRTQFEKDMWQLSGGQKKKILLARSLCQDAHLLIWDEPLNYIDLFSRIQLEDLLRETRPSLLFAEHDALFQERVASRVILL